MRTFSNSPARRGAPVPGRTRRFAGRVALGALLTATAGGMAYTAAASAGEIGSISTHSGFLTPRANTLGGACTPRDLSGCDGTDSPTPGDGRTLMYCGPDGTCTPVPGGASSH